MKVLTVFVDGEGHIRGDNLVVTNLAKLEGAVSVHSFDLQDAVVLLSLNNGGFVGLLLKHWRILIDVVHLDVDGGPEGYMLLLEYCPPFQCPLFISGEFNVSLLSFP